MAAFRLLSFMLNMELVYNMNSEQNKRVAVNAARWFCTHVENVAGGFCCLRAYIDIIFIAL
jgi:hypothetical protein